MPTTEEWRPVPGYEGQYAVSNHGRVRSLPRTIPYRDGRDKRTPGRILRPKTKKQGHQQVTLSQGGRQETAWVHRLVATAFHGAPPPGTECRHLNGVPHDNRAENLQWGTRSEQRYDDVRNGMHYQVKRTHCPQGHPLQEPNLVAWAAARGHRQCLACARARAAIQHYGTGDLQQVADQKYAAIMAATVSRVEGTPTT